MRALVVVILVSWGAMWVGAGQAGLPTFLLTDPIGDQLPLPGPGGQRLLTAAQTAAGFVLATSFRRRRVDVGLLVTCVWALLSWRFWSWFASEFEFTSASRRCVYADCWPRTPQDLAVGAPLIAASVLGLVLALSARWVAPWVRAIVPAVVLVALTVVQTWAWAPYVVPYLATPPG